MNTTIKEILKDIERAKQIQNKLLFSEEKKPEHIDMIALIMAWKKSVSFKLMQKIAKEQGFDLEIALYKVKRGEE